QEFEQRITIYSEFALSSNVNDIERIESQTIDGAGIIRLYFHPGVKISDSLAQATAVSQAILRRMPLGVQPPIILRYTAASVPIVQMSIARNNMWETHSSITASFVSARRSLSSTASPCRRLMVERCAR